MKNLIITIVILVVFILSCSKDNTTSSTTTPTPTPTSTKTTANITVDAQSNGTPLVLGKYYKLNSTDSIFISRLDFYVQNFVINTTDSLNSLKLFSMFDSSNIKYQVIKEVALNFNKFSFVSGLDGATNNTDPNTQSVNSPLGGNKNMFWTEWTRYRYVVVEGSIKTPDTAFNISFHTGKYFRSNTDLAKSIQIPQGSTQSIKIHLDVNKIFYPTSGTNIKYKEGETGAHADQSEEALTWKFANNFGGAFSIE